VFLELARFSWDILACIGTEADNILWGMQTQQDTVEVSNSANQAYSQQARQSSEAATQGYCPAPYIRPGTQCPHSSMLHHTIFSLSLSLLIAFLLLFIPQS
jgi:hypothetical protein